MLLLFIEDSVSVTEATCFVLFLMVQNAVALSGLYNIEAVNGLDGIRHPFIFHLIELLILLVF